VAREMGLMPLQQARDGLSPLGSDSLMEQVLLYQDVYEGEEQKRRRGAGQLQIAGPARPGSHMEKRRRSVDKSWPGVETERPGRKCAGAIRIDTKQSRRRGPDTRYRVASEGYLLRLFESRRMREGIPVQARDWTLIDMERIHATEPTGRDEGTGALQLDAVGWMLSGGCWHGIGMSPCWVTLVDS